MVECDFSIVEAGGSIPPISIFIYFFALGDTISSIAYSFNWSKDINYTQTYICSIICNVFILMIWKF